MISYQALPDVEEWGQKLVDGKLVPDWSDLLAASLAILDLIKCMCKSDKGCRGRCKYNQADLPCTELCKCKGKCESE